MINVDPNVGTSLVKDELISVRSLPRARRPSDKSLTAPITSKSSSTITWQEERHNLDVICVYIIRKSNSTLCIYYCLPWPYLNHYKYERPTWRFKSEHSNEWLSNLIAYRVEIMAVKLHPSNPCCLQRTIKSRINPPHRPLKTLPMYSLMKYDQS